METLIDTNLRRVPSLGEVEEFRHLARGLTELGVYSAYLSDVTQELDGTARALGLEDSLILRPYSTFATGVGIDKDGSYMALIMVHANEQDADENLELLREADRRDVQLCDRKALVQKSSISTVSMPAAKAGSSWPSCGASATLATTG